MSDHSAYEMLVRKNRRLRAYNRIIEQRLQEAERRIRELRHGERVTSYSCLGCGAENIPTQDLTYEQRHAVLEPDGGVNLCGPIVTITEPVTYGEDISEGGQHD